MALIGPSFASFKLNTAISGTFSRRPRRNSTDFIKKVMETRGKDEEILDLVYKIDNSFYPVNYPGLDKAVYSGKFDINVYSVSSKARWASMDKDRGLPDGYNGWKLGRKSVASVLHLLAELDLASQGGTCASGVDSENRIISFEERFKNCRPVVYEIVSNYIDGEYTHAMILPGIYLTESFKEKAKTSKKGRPEDWPIVDVSGHTSYGLEVYKIKEPIPDVAVGYHPLFRDILDG
jgi:hypothetical protein